MAIIQCEQCNAALTPDELHPSRSAPELCFTCASAEFWRGFHEAGAQISFTDIPVSMSTPIVQVDPDPYGWLDDFPTFRKWKAEQGN